MGEMTIMPSGSTPQTRQELPTSIQEIVASAVDSYDVAARLEAGGYGDAVARKMGYDHVFDWAYVLTKNRGALGEPKRRGEGLRPLANVAARILILFSGVALCLAVLPPNATVALMFISGATGWIWTQTVSAGIWRALSGGSRRWAASVGLTSAIPLVVLAVIISVIVSSPAPLLWGSWAISSSILVIMRGGLKLAAVAVAVALLTIILGGVSPTLGTVAAVVGILGATGDAVWSLIADKARPVAPTPDTLKVQALGAIQAAAQVSIFLMLLNVIGPVSFVAVAIAGLIGAATSDAALDLTQIGTRTIATRTTSWRLGRSATAGAGAASALGIAMATIAIALLIHSYLASADPRMPMLFATLLVTGVTIAASMFLRAGSAVGASATAVAACAAVFAVTQFGAAYPTMVAMGLLFLAFGSIMAALAVSAHCVARPVFW